jgi:predicted SprT family Zn-dependent metalloprotease
MTPEGFQRYLQRSTGRPISLRLNNNLHNLLSAARGPKRGEIKVSLHQMFLDAPKGVKEAIAGFIVRPTKENRQAVRAFVSLNTLRLTACRRSFRQAGLTSEGEVFDLRPIADRLNERYFGGKLRFEICWARRPTRRPRRMSNITLGVCHSHQRLIRIHPILDSTKVPLYYLQYIIYHEMAHLVAPTQVSSSGRLKHHHADFYAIERDFGRYREAIDWQDRFLGTLMASWCRESPPRPRRISENVQLEFL